ncbi:Hypothetical protein D9617_15g042110 [Elsinoe fawcettii]|nr:Hypothetical protein D9617_15g042110 [Elsinoe fawcettii]
MKTYQSKHFPGLDVPIQDLNAPKPGVGGYEPLNPRTETLKKDSIPHGTKGLPCDILVEHDFHVTVRDGAKLYMDVFRPTRAGPVPALICWSPFGKKFNGIASLKLMTPWNLGIAPDRLSGLEKFEAPDPADWIPEGYAIINVDSRGSGHSEGVCAIMGSQEAEDGYDVIEAIAKLPWCSGNVGLAGNSHLAIVQWFIAGLKPPSLKAIAPWEGCGDLFREQFARGGIYSGDLFDELIAKYMINGLHGMESFKGMFEKSPLANDWWNDKRPDMTKIEIPTYITGTWTNTMHGMGAIRGWLEVKTDQKWLRWHPTQEWYDLWGNQQAQDELLQFFDHFLKNKSNDWEKTPKIRMAVLRFGEKDPIPNIVENEFPLARTDYRKLYLSPDSKLSTITPTEAGSVSYDSTSRSSVASFTYTFTTRTRLLGLPKAVLYMSCPDNDDMDIYIILRKLSTSGKPMLNLNIPWSDRLPIKSIADIPEKERTEVILYAGPGGILRASHRAIDEEKSMHPHWPFHPHEQEEKMTPGEVVRLDIGIWAMGIEYEAGESVQVEIGGRIPGVSNFGTDRHSLNKGRHVLHFGAERGSHVVLPFV